MDYEIRSDESVSEAVIGAVSELKRNRRGEIGPLDGTVDPYALDVIFSDSDGRPRDGGRVSFVFEEYRITVEHNEYIEIRHV